MSLDYQYVYYHNKNYKLNIFAVSKYLYMIHIRCSYHK